MKSNTIEFSLIIQSLWRLYYFDNSESFHFKIMTLHAVQNSLPKSVGNAYQTSSFTEARSKKVLSLRVRNRFRPKSSLATASRNACGPFPFSCNLPPLPAYLWEMSTCSLDILQDGRAWPEGLCWLWLTPALLIWPPDHVSLLCCSEVCFSCLRLPRVITGASRSATSSVLKILMSTPTCVINNSTGTPTSTRWCAEELEYLGLKSFRLLLKQRTVSCHTFSGSGEEKTHHAKLQLSLCVRSREGWTFRNSLWAQRFPERTPAERPSSASRFSWLVFPIALNALPTLTPC